MDLLVWGQAEGISPEELSEAAGLPAAEVEAAYAEIDRRRVATEYLHAPATVVAAALKCAASPASSARARAPRSKSKPSSAWRGRSAIAGLTGSASASTTAPAWSRPGSRSSTSTSGWQPLRSGPEGSVLVYNGEVYNHPELRASLRSEGVEFETHSDTEVVQAVLEHRGLAGLDDLNGQFALAWWQPGPRRLTLVRDRFGVRPLLYALDERGSLFFGSEAKALFASGEVSAAPDPGGIDEVFTLWAPQSPRTTFAGVSAVEPGGLLVWERGRIVESRRWWSADPRDQPDPGAGLEELMRDSVNLRLRADVQVGAYLSGGLDSSLISALAQVEQRGELTTFSVAFDDPSYDERAHQETVARAIGTRHHVLEIGSADIAAALPAVIRHAETPLVRTAPVPLYLLAADVRDHDLKVVATGEGADELFWGYDLFKEVAIRDLHARDPERALELLGRLYPHLGSAARRGPGWTSFLLETGAGDDPLASHMTRVAATESVKAFYGEGMRELRWEATGRSNACDRGCLTGSRAGATSSAPHGWR